MDDFLCDHAQELLVVAGASGLLDDDLFCATCGRRLGTDPEDDPEGESGRPLCGECNRARNFDVIEEVELHEDEHEEDDEDW